MCLRALVPGPSSAITSNERLGRSKPARITYGSRSPSRTLISSATCSVAVAVQAITVGRAEPLDHPAQPQVVGPEVVAPLRHAVGLVDGEQTDLAPRQRRQERRGGEPLGRAQHDPGAALAHVGQRPRRRAGVHPRGDHRRRVPTQQQPPVLVGHQRDQRRDHHREVVGGDPRQLVAEALAAAGRHHHQAVSAVERRGHDLALAGPELVQAEVRRAARRGRAARRSGAADGASTLIRSRPLSAS